MKISRFRKRTCATLGAVVFGISTLYVTRENPQLVGTIQNKFGIHHNYSSEQTGDSVLDAGLAFGSLLTSGLEEARNDIYTELGLTLVISAFGASAGYLAGRALNGLDARNLLRKNPSKIVDRILHPTNPHCA